MKGKAKELYEDIKDCFPATPSLYMTERIKDLIEEYAEIYKVCPECLGDLEETSYKEYRGEEMGFKQYEEFYFKRCTSCGWEE